MEYRSNTRLLGLPLVHVAIGRGDATGRYRRGVATGWLAIGDIAVGVVLACGGVSLGGISLGGVAAGLLPIGGLAFGLLAFGGLALGITAIGGAAVGWHAAIGGLAMAHEYALGGFAFARHVLGPPDRDHSALSTIPHAPFDWPDAVVLALLVAALIMVALSIRRRRES
jgi:hypothetical protein